ncbi:baseplate J/gp47 family protein, partial [uncultured Methylobacterium sp.]|uniref:baseplate J/gp47 family protein n=1 Tax=uncultured Methylobacterium sp. TaxID=157278 RepID=UPI00258659B0
IPIVGATGDGAASPELVATVQAATSPKNRRPMADFVTASAAIIVPYAIRAIVYVGQGPDRDEVKKRAIDRLTKQALRQHRPGAPQRLRMLYGAASVPDASGRNVTEDVELLSPLADVNGTAITPATPQGAYRAPYCTGIEVEVRLADG